MKKRWAAGLLVVLLLGITLLGSSYYLASMGGRVRSPLHTWYRSSGYVGQSLGILAFAGFAFMWLYPLRKRARRLAARGSLPRWLEVHILVGLFLPWVVALHAGWRFGGLAGVAFVAIVVVWASGIVGRYLYGRIPRSRNGLELTREDIANQRRELAHDIAAAVGWDPDALRLLSAVTADVPTERSPWGVIRRLSLDDLERRRTLGELRRRWKGSGTKQPLVDPATLDVALRLARQEMSLAQQVRMLDATRRIFRYWHAAHLPVAITAVLAVLVHVTVVIYLGATWFR